MLERAIDILVGAAAGVLAGLVAVLLGMLGTMSGTPADASGGCTGLTVATLVVGGLCGALVSWRRGRDRLPDRRRRP